MKGSRIVVGIDGSATSQEALRWAIGLSGVLGAEVVAVHALGLLDRWHDPETSARSWRKTLCGLVEHTWCAPLLRAPGAHRVEVRDGHPVDVLLAAAARERASLLVVGSRGVGANPALALGSTSLRVLQEACLPVLVVPDGRDRTSGDGNELRLRHLLVGVDGSGSSLAALDVAADVAEMLGGSLSVLYAFECVPPFPVAPHGDRGGEGREGLREQALELLERAARDIRQRGVGVQVVLRSGVPAQTLLELADDVDADLVVVGTRGRGGSADLLLGSVARTVADGARCPTLVVPAAAGRVHLDVRAHDCAGQRTTA
jgi:nucleotide-binding universal stress UspA family protein